MWKIPLGLFKKKLKFDDEEKEGCADVCLLIRK